MSALDGQQLAVVDIEGHGGSPPQIVEIAVLPVDDGEPAPIQTWLVRPTEPISPIVTRRVHGIRNDDVAGAPAWAEIADQVHRALRGRVLVAHHAAVEQTVLHTHLPDWHPTLVLDTLRLARHVHPGRVGYSLDALTTADKATPGQRHRAAHDTTRTHQLLRALITAADLDWTRLRTHAALPLTDQETLW